MDSQKPVFDTRELGATDTDKGAVRLPSPIDPLVAPSPPIKPGLWPNPSDRAALDKRGDSISTLTGYSVVSGPPSLLFFWMSAYIGTCIAGATFGAGVMVVPAVLGNPNYLWGAIFTGAFGAIYAGFVGAFMFPTIAIIAWAGFFVRRAPYLAAAMAGGCTGAVCGLPAGWIAIVTASLGVLGAVWFGYLATRGHRERLADAPGERFHFSLQDLFLRMTAIGVLLGGWLFVLRVIFGLG